MTTMSMMTSKARSQPESWSIPPVARLLQPNVKSDWAMFVWQRRMWFEAMFGLSVLETWEYVLLGTFFMSRSTGFLPFPSLFAIQLFLHFTLVCDGL